MSTAILPSQPETYLGHVRRGVIVLDAPIPLVEGAPVRIELLPPVQPSLSPSEKSEKFRALMKKWNEEDAQLSEEQQDVLRKALEENRGLRFSSTELDDLLT